MVPLGFLAVFFVWPVVAIMRLGFDEGGVLATLGTARVWRLVGFTVAQAAGATVVAVVAGLPVAFLLARTNLPGLGIIRVIILVPFVLPSVVVGLAFRAMLPDGGVWAIVLANAFFNVAVVARTVAGLWTHLDRRAEDAARALGASRLRTFTSVTLPALAPAIGSAAAVVFLFCATSFGVVLILGGARLRTLETEIYLRTVELLDLPGAAALSLLQVGAVVAVLSVGAVARRRRETALRLRGQAESARRPAGGEWAVVAAALGVVVLLCVPIASLVLRSLSTPDGWGLDGYRALTGVGYEGSLQISGLDAARNSLAAATDATLLAVTLGTMASVVLVTLARDGRGTTERAPSGLTSSAGPCARNGPRGRAAQEGRRRLSGGVKQRIRHRVRYVEVVDTAFMLPLGVSAVTVGFGYLITLDLLPGDLRTSPVLVPLAQALVVTPLVIRVMLPVLRSIDERLRQAAGSLGASPWRVWWEVDVPMAGRSLLTAAAFGYVVALGEFGATSFLARPDTATLPVAVARLISRPGELNNQMAYAACTLLVLVTVAVVAVVERVRVPVGEF
ncbi:ABC transporter permease [Actinophytocola oryzae]|uniref:ABC transporter permease n=1 Tax=Actinophytocola oryzae TaxID=502181 RepID=UPI003C7A3E02